ncbi:MAG TPA: uroporphyrinogen decarboxylase family protein, partial [Bacteroidota bacterium]|nr:uroporphyrinogen decarboxylase family protein [Bacteroidota bacterium]
EALPQFRPTTIVLGNIDPVSVIQRGTEEDVRRVVSGRLMQTAAFPNHVLSSGCDIPYTTPLKNLDMMFRVVDEYNSAQH